MRTVVACAELADELQAMGHLQQAWLLRIIHSAFEGTDASGWTSAERTISLHNRCVCPPAPAADKSLTCPLHPPLHCYCYPKQSNAVLNPRLSSTAGAAKAQSTAHLLFVCVADCRTLLIPRLLGDRLYQPYDLPAKVHGISTQLLLSWLTNGDSRMWIM